MATYKKRPNFFESDEGITFIKALADMAKDSDYNTEASYSANTGLYPDNIMPFVNKHIDYIKSHPTIDPRHYLANLRLMTKIG